MPANEIVTNLHWSVWPLLTLGSVLMIGPGFLMCKAKRDGACKDSRVDENLLLQPTHEARHASEEKLRAILAATNEGLWIINPVTGKIIDANIAICCNLGYTQNEIIGKTPLDFANSKNKLLMQRCEEMTEASSHQEYEVELITKDGTSLPVKIRSTTLMSKTHPGTVATSFAFIKDISHKKRYEDELYRQTHYGPTTGMPNRPFMIKHIQALIGAGKEFGLILIDLDNFKLYNDTFGHSFGDTLLKKVSKRLKETLDETEFLAHLGGDEFVVVSRKPPEGVAATAKKVLKLFTDQPITTKSNNLYVGLSIGVSSYPKDGEVVDELMRGADLALHHVKIHGKGQVCIYSNKLDQNQLEKIELGNNLRTALQRNEFSLMYQPQVSTITGEILGVEALLRWSNSELGSVAPDRFIPLLEETGLIVGVGEWVLRTACTQTSEWHANGYPIRLSVNLSSRQFQETDLANMVRNIVADTAISPKLLMLEITESLLMGDMSSVIKRLESVTNLGVCFSIDDFGTGYSSLSYLQKLPIKEVKIDRAFVMRLAENNGDMVIVKTIVAMANSFGMETVAEGVEDQCQLDILKEIGATMVQSYFTGRPMAPDQITDLLTDRQIQAA